MLETQSDMAERLAIEQGKLSTTKHLLLEGVDEQIICKAVWLSKQELAKIKRDLDRS